MTFAKLMKPQYANVKDVPAYTKIFPQLVMGVHATPSVPMFIRQATAGQGEGTSGNKPGIGAGNGVMIAGDVCTFARRYCKQGIRIDYRQYPLLSHTPAGVVFMGDVASWLANRFAGKAAPNNCTSIAPGNKLSVS